MKSSTGKSIAMTLTTLSAASVRGTARLVALAALLGALAGLAEAQPFQVLHNFSGNLTDGANPNAGLIQDSGGDLYGTTSGGGATGAGTVFVMSTQGVEKLLFSFPWGQGGQWPYAGLVQDSKGYLYGTTYQGGDPSCTCGVVFRMGPKGDEKVLYSFNGLDGQLPSGGLVLDSSGNLYGTTRGGGTNFDGTVFKLSPSGSETVLYSFNQWDGREPVGGLVLDSSGNLYGTTYDGGTNFQGTVFKLSPNGSETVLYSFKGKADGSYPYGGLVLDNSGNLYGTTAYQDRDGNGCGTLFALSPAGRFRVLHQFAGPDGCQPQASLTRDANGNLFGTTSKGGAYNGGTVFFVNPQGVYGVLHSFNGADGWSPSANLILDRRSVLLYGTTAGGGAYGLGTVFSLAP